MLDGVSLLCLMFLVRLFSAVERFRFVKLGFAVYGGLVASGSASASWCGVV